MQGRLQGTALSGVLGVDMRLVIDGACPESSDVAIEVDASALSVDWCPVGVSRLRAGGSCEMHDSWGNRRTIDLDPSSNASFVTLDSMPREFEALLCCAEDGEFRRHSGFSPDHIRSSLIANLSSGQFVRGASTITMQLARNLFLSRERTLSRKLQEVFLTWMLERALSKDRMLEIYANIVELGPDVFGFPEAAGYYFGSRIQDLSPRQLAFLVSILPGPRPYHRFFERGSVPAYWEEYLDVLLRGAGNRGALTSEEEESARAARISFPGHP
jgi:membrane peptidoglycan carboxypeptidase